MLVTGRSRLALTRFWSSFTRGRFDRIVCEYVFEKVPDQDKETDEVCRVCELFRSLTLSQHTLG